MCEPLASGLARADAAVVLLPADLAEPDPALVAQLGATTILVAHLVPTQAPPPGPQMGFAGVGKPWKVERALRAAGCELVDFAGFADHLAYDEATLRRIAARAGQFDAGLVTTEKDWVRLPAEWRPRVTPWPVEARFDAPAALDALLSRLPI
jgi:tetraacyldisaccharide 4'-kinase